MRPLKHKNQPKLHKFWFWFVEAWQNQPSKGGKTGNFRIRIKIFVCWWEISPLKRTWKSLCISIKSALLKTSTHRFLWSYYLHLWQKVDFSDFQLVYMCLREVVKTKTCWVPGAPPQWLKLWCLRPSGKFHAFMRILLRFVEIAPKLIEKYWFENPPLILLR